MRKFLLLLLVNCILVLLQSAFFFELLGVFLNPNLVLALALALFFVGSTKEAFLSGLLGGLLLDLVGTSPIGLSSLVFVSMLYGLSFVRKYMFRGLVLRVLAVFIFSAGYLSLMGGIATNFGSLVVQVGATTFVATLIFYSVIRKVFGEATSS